MQNLLSTNNNALYELVISFKDDFAVVNRIDFFKNMKGIISYQLVGDKYLVISKEFNLDDFKKIGKGIKKIHLTEFKKVKSNIISFSNKEIKIEIGG